MRYSPFLLAIALSVTAACSGKHTVGAYGYSEAYAEGYSDGCASNKKRGLINDDDRFDSETDYATGWSDGFRGCETDAEAAERFARIDNLNRGVAAAHNEYFESYEIGQQPSKKVSGSSIRIW